MPLGADPAALTRPRQRQLRPGIDFLQSAVGSVDVAASTVHLADGTALAYDVLVVATGAVLVPEDADGLLGSGWAERVFTFFCIEDLYRLFPGGPAKVAARIAGIPKPRGCI